MLPKQNIHIKDNKNNKNNDNNDNNNNKTTSKQLGCDIIVISLVILILDILCTEEPPAIPHDDEYNESMEKDDGRVSIEHYVYPGLESPYAGLHISTLNQSEIPRNYMANLT